MTLDDLAEAIDRVLPQTQCTRCGYPDCRAYAEAIASGAAAINRCPPGGDDGIRRLADLAGRPVQPLDSACGVARPRHVAVIDEPACIGCTLCIQACPVDAIVGAPGQMHTVIVELCTGCDLCVAPCPVDCIAMVPAVGSDALWDTARATAARHRYESRRERLARAAAERHTADPASASPPQEKPAAIAAALERARARRREAATGGESAAPDDR